MISGAFSVILEYMKHLNTERWSTKKSIDDNRQGYPAPSKTKHSDHKITNEPTMQHL